MWVVYWLVECYWVVGVEVVFGYGIYQVGWVGGSLILDDFGYLGV